MFRKFFLSFLALLLTLCFTVFFLVFNLKYFFLQSDFYKNILAKTNFYENVLSSLPNLLVQENSNELSSSISLGEVELPQEDIIYLISHVVAPSYLQAEFENLLDELFNYLNGVDATFSPVISLVPLKENLVSTLPVYLDQKLNELPVCLEEELVYDSNGELQITDLKCRPSSIDVETLKNSINSMELDSFISQIPDSFSFFPVEDSNSEGTVAPGPLQEIQYYVSLITHEVYLISLLLSILFLLVISLVARSWSSRLSWIGGSFFNFSLWPLLTLLVSFFKGKEIFNLIINNSGFNINLQTLPLPPDFLNTIFREFELLFLKEFAVIFVFSLILLIISKIMKNKEAKDREQKFIEKVEAEAKSKSLEVKKT